MRWGTTGHRSPPPAPGVCVAQRGHGHVPETGSTSPRGVGWAVAPGPRATARSPLSSLPRKRPGRFKCIQEAQCVTGIDCIFTVIPFRVNYMQPALCFLLLQLKRPALSAQSQLPTAELGPTASCPHVLPEAPSGGWPCWARSYFWSPLPCGSGRVCTWRLGVPPTTRVTPAPAPGPARALPRGSPARPVCTSSPDTCL